MTDTTERIRSIINDALGEYIEAVNRYGGWDARHAAAKEAQEWLGRQLAKPIPDWSQVPIPDWDNAPESAIYWTCHPGTLTETWWNEPPQTEHVYFYAARPDNDRQAP